MRKWMNLVESNIGHTIEVRGSHSGQVDLTMLFQQAGQTLGYIEYSVHQGDVHIQMIKVTPEERRKGLGREMLRALQREYPETEINVGGMTPEGSALVGAMKTRDIPNGDVGEKRAELEHIRATLADYKQRHEELVASQDSPDFDARRIAFIDEVSDSWNDLASREWELMQELGDKKSTKRIFESEFPFKSRG